MADGEVDIVGEHVPDLLAVEDVTGSLLAGLIAIMAAQRISVVQSALR